jgi:hypothetical protein
MVDAENSSVVYSALLAARANAYAFLARTLDLFGLGDRPGAGFLGATLKALNGDYGS